MTYTEKHKIWFKLLVFLGLFLFLDFLLAKVFSVQYKHLKMVGAGVSVNQILESNAEIVIFGNSRAMHHFDSRFISKETGMSVYNAGRDGQGLPYFYALSELICKKHHPRIFVIQIEPPYLSKTASQESYPRLSILSPFIEDSPLLRKMLCNQDLSSRILYQSRSFQYNRQLLYFLYDRFTKDNYEGGYAPIDKTMDQEKYKNSDTGAPKIEKRTIDYDLLAMLKEMIQTARNKGINVVLCSTPRWPLKQYDWDYEEKGIEILNQIAKQENIPFFNITFQKYPELQDANLYADPHHLNRDGARVFSRIFSKKLADNTLTLPQK